ncbi:MAG TPA: hypothetical protein VGG28_23935 [Kofleriaceae bacterium]|jgi:hypothetical protein
MRYAIVLVLLGACGVNVYETPINAPPAAMTARAPTSVEVFTSGAPARAHVDIAVLQAEPETGLADSSGTNLVGKLRATAAAMGCDGLVVTQLDSHHPGAFEANETHTASGTCVMWTR